MTWDRNSVAGQSPDERIRSLERMVESLIEQRDELRRLLEWLASRDAEWNAWHAEWRAATSDSTEAENAGN